MSTTIVPANDVDVRLPLEMDCADAPIVSSCCSSGSASMSIEAVALVLGCPALPLGIVPGGDVGLGAVDGLGTDCALLVWGGTVSSAVANVTPLVIGPCTSGSI
eukprot:5257139-Amphidinium_carterae.1